MMQVIDKWHVRLTFPDRTVELWIDENYLSNVLRQIAALSFSANGLAKPTEISIRLVDL